MILSVRQVAVLGHDIIITHALVGGYCFSFESAQMIYYDTPIDGIHYWLQCMGGYGR
jgi:hypothetical protein